MKTPRDAGCFLIVDSGCAGGLTGGFDFPRGAERHRGGRGGGQGRKAVGLHVPEHIGVRQLRAAVVDEDMGHETVSPPGWRLWLKPPDGAYLGYNTIGRERCQ